MQFDTYIFDWDGTLMDSVPRIVDVMQKVAVNHNLSYPSADQVKAVIGISLPRALQIVYNIAESDIEWVRNAYRDEYNANTTPIPLFQGVVDMLQTLKSRGATLAVATGKGRPGLDAAIANNGLSDVFSTSRCADDAKSKPDPDMVHQIMTELGCHPERTVMIGDSIHDLGMAKAANIAGLGVSYGAHSVAQLTDYNPIAIVDNPLEILDF